MLSPGGHAKLRAYGRGAMAEYLTGLVQQDDVPAEALETYASGLVEGLVDCLSVFCGRAAAVAALASGVERFPSLRAELRRNLGERFAIPPDAPLHELLRGADAVGAADVQVREVPVIVMHKTGPRP